MKSDKVDSAAKVVPRPIPYAAETDSPAGNEETARVGNCEKSTKPASGEAAEIYVLLKPYLLKTWTYSKAAKETANNMADSELVALKGSNISAPTPLQLEIACQKIVDLKTRLDAIQVKHESAENEIGCYIPHIQDLEFAVSKLCFAAYAKDEKLIAAYNQVIHFKRIVDRIKPQVLELQGVLKINESLKKEVDELQSIHASIGEVVGKVSAQAGAAEGEAPDDTAAKSVAATEGVTIE
ncbi:hypothetical protein COP2_047568 [Malus domestica]